MGETSIAAAGFLRSFVGQRRIRCASKSDPSGSDWSGPRKWRGIYRSKEEQERTVGKSTDFDREDGVRGKFRPTTDGEVRWEMSADVGGDVMTVASSDLAPNRYDVVDGRIACVRRGRAGNEVIEPLANFVARIDEEITRDDGVEVSREFAIGGELDTGASLPRARVTAREFGGLGLGMSCLGCPSRRVGRSGDARPSSCGDPETVVARDADRLPTHWLATDRRSLAVPLSGWRGRRRWPEDRGRPRSAARSIHAAASRGRRA